MNNYNYRHTLNITAKLDYIFKSIAKLYYFFIELRITHFIILY